MRLKPILLRIAVAAACLAPACFAQEGNVIGEVYTSDASVHGSVVFAGGGTQITSGSTVAAGSATTVVRLIRGGEVRLCSGTGLTLNATLRGNGLLMSMNTGDMELHYGLRSSADTLVTPDFRITLAGPGEFHVGFGADRLGNTCVRTLPGNTASLLVTEVFGDGAYQVKPNERVSFHGGHVSDATDTQEPCGCPAPAAALRTARSASVPKAPEQPSATKTAALRPAPVVILPKAEPIAAAQPASAEPVLTSSAAPPVVNLTVETPFVYSAGANPEPVDVADVKALEVPASIYLRRDDALVSELPQYSILQLAETRAVAETKEKKSFGRRFRSFFASIFKH